MGRGSRARRSSKKSADYPSMLWKAAKEGDLELLQLELSRPAANLEVCDARNKQTPLMVATRNNHLECVRKLLLAGADPDAAFEHASNNAKIRRMLKAGSAASSYARSKKNASKIQERCRRFARGRCQYGDSCRFLHIVGVAESSSRRGAAAPAEKLAYGDDMLLTFEEATSASAMRQYVLSAYPGCKVQQSDFGDGSLGLSASDCESVSDELEARFEDGGYLGFTGRDVEELWSQGVKPWDEDAWDVLAVLNGYDEDEDDDDYENFLD